MTATMEATEVDTLLALADAEKAAFEAWQDGDDEFPGADYWQALDAMVHEYEGEVPGHAIAAWQDLVEAYEQFNASGGALPGRRFMAAREAVQRELRRTPPKLDDLPPMAVLINEQGLTPVQAARVWKLLDGDKPLVHLVHAELDKPGSVLTAEYVDRVNRIRLADAGFGAPPETVWRREKPPARKATQPLEDLIQQRVPLAQIATIKAAEFGGKPEDWKAAAELLASVMGVEVPPTGKASLNAEGKKEVAKKSGKNAVTRQPAVTAALVPGEIQPKTEIEKATDGADDTPIEQQISELSDAGHDEQTIAQHFNIPLKKVTAILKRAQAEEEAGEDV